MTATSSPSQCTGPGHAIADVGDSDPAAQVLRQFRIVFNAVKTHFQQVERRVGLGGAQVWALSVIRDRPGLGVKGLAGAMDVRQPTASNLVRSLVRSGLIEVRRDGSDRRSVQLHLLPEGHRLLRRVPGPYRGVLPDALKALPPEALARMQADLAALIGHLNPDPRAAQVPLAEM
ncbi:MAG: MarR family winged helix-turn-helix transcriptional regulator [Ideonella sp.]|jgi:DNA-binding MarR family transcriptional regulator|nr:MarR family winged helix-turn-helix transcriptional regulator [Ideonella sp.]